MTIKEIRELIAQLELEKDPINKELIAYYKGFINGVESVKASINRVAPSFCEVA